MLKRRNSLGLGITLLGLLQFSMTACSVTVEPTVTETVDESTAEPTILADYVGTWKSCANMGPVYLGRTLVVSDLGNTVSYSFNIYDAGDGNCDGTALLSMVNAGTISFEDESAPTIDDDGGFDAGVLATAVKYNLEVTTATLTAVVPESGLTGVQIADMLLGITVTEGVHQIGDLATGSPAYLGGPGLVPASQTRYGIMAFDPEDPNNLIIGITASEMQGQDEEHRESWFGQLMVKQ